MDLRRLLGAAAGFGLIWAAACGQGDRGAPPAPSSASAATSTTAAPSSAASTAASTAPPHETPRPLEGADYGEDAKTLFRVAACGGKGPIPKEIDPTVVEKHCKELTPQIEKYKTDWVGVAGPFVAKLRPANLPKKVVYPFGGGDLLTALMVFPDADEITTISLESAGDVRGFHKLSESGLSTNLGLTRSDVARLFLMSFHSTSHLDVESKSKLTGEVFFSLLALAVHGYEPVSLRYFTLQKDGSLHYLSKEEIESAPKSSPLFDDMEMGFIKPGDPDHVKVIRHIAQNLDDTHFTADSPLYANLVAKGDVSAITKAAHHLLWSEDFSRIRSYLADHAVWMISDSTGIPPRIAKEKGLVQDTYGTFAGPAPYGMINDRDSGDLRKLFEANPKQPIPFFFGYWDSGAKGHILVTRRPGS